MCQYANWLDVYKRQIQDKARNVGFDWEEREQVWDKVKEEIQEFQAEVAPMDKEKAEAEFGDVMFLSLIHISSAPYNQSLSPSEMMPTCLPPGTR